MVTRSTPRSLARSAGDQEVERAVGVLRAVDLDKNLLRLERPSGPLTFTKAEDIYDDIIGPLLNKPVVITCARPKGRGKRQLVASDIELAVEGSDLSARAAS